MQIITIVLGQCKTYFSNDMRLDSQEQYVIILRSTLNGSTSLTILSKRPFGRNVEGRTHEKDSYE